MHLPRRAPYRFRMLVAGAVADIGEVTRVNDTAKDVEREAVAVVSHEPHEAAKVTLDTFLRRPVRIGLNDAAFVTA